MIDWEGLLKFSLQYSDGTKKSEFKEMSQNDKKWLQQAMKHYCNSELERIKTILQQLSKPEQNSEQQIRKSLLEQLQQILDSLDKGSTLYKMGGHIILLKIVFFSKYESNRIVALQIFSSINQNDAYIQTQSINSGALQLVEVILKEQSVKLRQNIIGAVSAMVRGQNLQAKRIFIRINGLTLLQKLLSDQTVNSQRLQNKVFVLIRDLLFYDDRLHYTYNDLSSFSNTANIVQQKKEELKNKKHDLSEKQGKGSLTYDKNKIVENNQLEQNKKFRGSVNSWIHSQNNVKIEKQYQIWLAEQLQAEQS